MFYPGQHPSLYKGFFRKYKGIFCEYYFSFFHTWKKLVHQVVLVSTTPRWWDAIFCNQDVVFTLDDLNEDHSPLEFIFSRNQDSLVYYNLCFNEDTQLLSITYVLMRRSSFLKVACIVKIKLFFWGLILL